MRLLLLAFAAFFATSLTSCYISPLPTDDQSDDTTAFEEVVVDTISDTVNEVRAFGSTSDSVTTGD